MPDTQSRVRLRRIAVFRQSGPYAELHLSWLCIYRDWLPATGYPLRDEAPFEHYLDDPASTAARELRADIYIPLE